MTQGRQVRSISPDPVVNAVVELRFDCSVPKPAVYGIMYAALKAQYGKPESLPVMQLPEQIRLNDASFRWKPWYRLSGPGVTAQVGPDVLALNCDCDPAYMKWHQFWPLIQNTLAQVRACGVVTAITRIGVRYISFFEGVNIFDRLKLTVTLDGQPLSSGATSFVTVLNDGGLLQRLALNNDVQLHAPAGDRKGSTVDIDTFQALNLDSFDAVETIICQAHRREKERFFALLRDDFLAGLNPEYEDGG